MADSIKRRKPDELRKTIFLRVRLTEEQDKLIRDAAQLAGILVSPWAVERLVRAAREELPEAPLPKPKGKVARRS
jgi:uncharacterized protein (DUF1778 family)